MEKIDNLSRIITAIQASKKYQHIDPILIQRIAQDIIPRYKSHKDQLKATKTKLHQVATIYQTNTMPYASWLSQLKNASNEEHFRQISKQIMSQHVSTRERLPIHQNFYAEIFANLPPISSIIDVACGLNPLNLPWIPFTTPITYHASDIFTDMIDFLNQVFTLRGINGHASLCDLTHHTPSETADVAFILKTIPCLEQVNKSIGLQLLENIRANYLVISYPTKSIAKKEKGMSNFYANQFANLVSDKPWHIKHLDFANELVFIVDKTDQSSTAKKDST